jgi:predicted RNA-binding Zn-ribbon protein involved in translation (DUF1610 family)
MVSQLQPARLPESLRDECHISTTDLVYAGTSTSIFREVPEADIFACPECGQEFLRDE